MTPQQIAALFVDLHSDFPKVQEIGHTFIHGARGTGKSMLLRYMEPSVITAVRKAQSPKNLHFFAVHIPIKKANLKITEVSRLNDSANVFFSEHMMVMHICNRVFSALADYTNNSTSIGEVKDLFESTFVFLLKAFGWKESEGLSLSNKNTAHEIFSLMARICEQEFLKGNQYLRKLSWSSEIVPYEGALFGYLDFFVPIIERIGHMSLTPDGPVYLMIDDADNLSLTMHKILNSWVSYRTTDFLCLKISTQLRYKTYRTLDGRIIECPHDYSEVDVGTIYTNKAGQYSARLSEIVRKRLTLSGINKTPEQFFPPDENQEVEIDKIKERLKKRWTDGGGRGYRASDDVTRYARPDYMKSLSGKSKSSSSFSYSGFNNLVDLSSGVIRNFLEPASQMFGDATTKVNDGNQIESIPSKDQDKVINKWAESFLLGDFDKIKGSPLNNPEMDASISTKLYTLINSLGKLFRELLLDDSLSERRFISVMVSGQPSKEVNQVFALGMEWGYFQKSTIGAKERSGRNVQYILNRRLAPYFKLDPSGYAAYLSVTPEALEVACIDDNKFVRDRIKSLKKHADIPNQQVLL